MENEHLFDQLDQLEIRPEVRGPLYAALRAGLGGVEAGDDLARVRERMALALLGADSPRELGEALTNLLTGVVAQHGGTLELTPGLDQDGGAIGYFEAAADNGAFALDVEGPDGYRFIL